MVQPDNGFRLQPPPPPWGGAYKTKFCRGSLRSEVQPFTLLHPIFERKGAPIIYLLLTNDTPFTYLV